MQVVELNIYPIKSTVGISLEQAQVGSRGLSYDRHWVLVNNEGQAVTAREYPKLLDIRTELCSDGLKVYCEHSELFVLPFSTSDTSLVDISVFEEQATGLEANPQASEWFSDYLGIECRLIYMNQQDHRRLIDYDGKQTQNSMSYADECPVLLISEASLDDLNTRLERPVSMKNFRPNIVVSGCGAYAEDQWKNLKIGTLEFKSLWQCQRCVFTTIDPVSKQRHPQQEPLRTLSKYRKHPDGGVAFGMHFLPSECGIVRVGDRVEFA